MPRTGMTRSVSLPVVRSKGNINAEGECIYHSPGGRDYERVVMENCDDQGKCAKGKRYFCSAAEAEAAGCRPPKR